MKNKLIKLSAIILSFLLMMSAIPFNFTFFAGKPKADAVHAELMKIIDDKITNKEEVYYRHNVNGADIYYWVTNADPKDNIGRSYNISVYFELSGKPDRLKYKENIGDKFIKTNYKFNQEVFIYNEDEGLIFNENVDFKKLSDEDFSVSYTLDVLNENTEAADMMIPDINVEYNDVQENYPLDLKSPLHTDKKTIPVISSNKNGKVIFDKNETSLQITANSNTPAEIMIYQADKLTSNLIDIKDRINKSDKFDLPQINKIIKKSKWNYLEKATVKSKENSIDISGMQVDNNTTCLMVLYKDAVNHISAEIVEIKMPECKAVISYIDVTDLQNETSISKDTIKRLKGLWYELDAKEIPDYTFVGVDKSLSPLQGSIGNDDFIVRLKYKKTNTAAKMMLNSKSQIIRPTNPLGRYPGSTNEAVFSFSDISNTGNVDLKNLELIFKVPDRNDKGEPILLNVNNFSTGKYQSGTDNSVSIYYKTNKNLKWVSAIKNNDISNQVTIQVNDLLLVSNEYITGIKYMYNEIPVGFTVDIAPQIATTLSYKGFTENFTISGTAILTAEYNNNFNGKSVGVKYLNKKIETDTIQVYNPVFDLNVKYLDESGKTIPSKNSGNWHSINKKVQAYHHFGKYPNVAIPNYISNSLPADQPANAIQYNASEFSGYMPEENVTIIYRYIQEEPDVLKMSINSKYENLYPNDRNSFYLDNLGIDHGNSIHDYTNYEVSINIPKGFVLSDIDHPVYYKSNLKYDFSYKTNMSSDWIIKRGLDAYKSEYTNFNLKNGEYVTQLKYNFSNSSGKFPAGTFNITRMILSGKVDKDIKQNELILTASAAAYYEDINYSTGKNEIKNIKKDAQKRVSISLPQTLDVSKKGAARIQAGESFMYEISNIENKGNSPLHDYTIKDNLPDSMYTTGIYTGKYSGVSGSEVIIKIVFSDGDKETMVRSSLTNEYIAFWNRSIKSIEISFGLVSSGFKATEPPKICVKVKDYILNDFEFQNEITVSAKQISENDSSNINILKNDYTIKTKVVKPEIGIPVLTVKPKILNKEIFNVTADDIANTGNTEIYEYGLNFDLPESLSVLSVNTGTWQIDEVWKDNNLKVQYKSAENENWETLELISDFSKNVKIDFPKKQITKVRMIFSVVPKGFKNIVSPKLTLQAAADLPEEHKFTLNASITGKFGPHDLPSLEKIPSTDSFASITQKSANAETIIIIPKMAEYRADFPSQMRFDKEIEYTVSDIENIGQSYLHDVWFSYEIPYEANLKSIKTGRWFNAPEYTVYYKTTVKIDKKSTISDWIVLESDITENKFLKIPGIALESNEKISAVKFHFGTVPEGFKMLESPVIKISLDSDINPGYTLNSKFNFNAFGGFTLDPLKPEKEELKNMDYDFSKEKSLTTIIFKPFISSPKIGVSSETIKYRAKFNYTVNDISNSGNTPLEDFYTVNSFSDRVRLISIQTPTFNEDGVYDIMYKTNTDKDAKWTVWEKGINRAKSKLIFTPDMKNGQYITEVALWIGNVNTGFKELSEWKINCINWSSAYELADVQNITGINGNYEELRLSGKDSIIYSPELPDLVKSNVSRNNNSRIYPTQEINYKYDNIVNKTQTTMDYFSITDEFNKYIRPVSVITGKYTVDKGNESVSILCKTNKSDKSWKTIVREQSLKESKEIAIPKLGKDEHITEIKFFYGSVDMGFAAVENPEIKVSVADNLPNDKEITSNLKLEGYIDDKIFAESKESKTKSDYGWIEIELLSKQSNAKIADNYKYYGLTKQSYKLPEHPIAGYTFANLEGKKSGVFKKGYTGTVKYYYNELPKLGLGMLLSWQFMLGAAIMFSIGLFSIYQYRKKDSAH